jgi:hypothetical protein
MALSTLLVQSTGFDCWAYPGQFGGDPAQPQSPNPHCFGVDVTPQGPSVVPKARLGGGEPTSDGATTRLPDLTGMSISPSVAQTAEVRREFVGFRGVSGLRAVIRFLACTGRVAEIWTLCLTSSDRNDAEV